MAAQADSMRGVAAVLEHFLCPGGKLRLSPYVEATQCAVLLGERPDPKRHHPSLREVVGKAEHAAKFDAIAQRMLSHPGVTFGDAFFARRESLELYFAHYFPANLGKLQLVLLDLLRADQFPEKLHLVDLGLGPGTSFLAVLDFVLALGAMADLAGAALPLRVLGLRGYDRSQVCLDYTREVLDALGPVLTGYREYDPQAPGPSTGPALSSAWRLVEKALEEVRLLHVDIGGPGLVEFAEPSLVVLSYVLNDLREQRSVEAFEARLACLPEGSRLIVLEPGQQTTATELMRWRRSLVRRMPHLHPVLPCGQEFGVELPASCDRCWCARRQDIHGSPLQRAYLDCLEQHQADCEPERRRQIRRNFERLSWSYCVLASLPPEVPCGSTPPSAALQRYVGLRRSLRPGETAVAGEAGTNSAREERQVALCPARVEPSPEDCQSAVLLQAPGKVLPALRFGELVVLDKVEKRNQGGDVIFTLNRDSQVRQALPEAAVPRFDNCPASLDTLARRLFGFPALHDFQHKIIRRVLEGRNTLGIAATASGKTECFLLPALLLPGLTVVVSPLRSLMQDQWERCDERYGLGAVTTYLNGDVDYGERLRRLCGMREGRYKLAYFTPEQLARNHVRAALQRTAVSVLAIDEAHCVSQWGHDFRPDYLNMVRRLRACWERRPVVVALTATAGERVRRDLCGPALFNLDNRPVEEGGDVVFHGSNRLELDLVVRVEPDAAARSRRIVQDLEPFTQPSAGGSAIVFLPYTGARVPGEEEGQGSAAVEPFAAWLERQLGQRVSTYHGQMGEGVQTEVGTFLHTRWRRDDNDWGVYLFQGPQGAFCGVGHLREPTPGVCYTMAGRWQEFEKYGWQFLFETCVAGGAAAPPCRPLGDVTGRDRRAEQRAFMRSRNRIMVATKGFGMGIDKPDIRLVIHHSPPGDLLSYAQEVGRAARDGSRGQVILYYTEGEYPTATGHTLTDRYIQERFIEGRYVRESDLRACIAFLRQCPRLEIDEPGTGLRTYAVFSFAEVEAYLSALGGDPTPAGLPRPYEWPAYKQRQKVVGLTLEVLFKTVVVTAGGGLSLLESCQEVATCLRGPVVLDWQGLQDSNADLLREVLQRERIGREEFEALCGEAAAGDLLPLARKLRCTVGDTVGFLLEASYLGVIRGLRLGTRGAASGDERGWEVCLSPVLLSGEGLDALLTSVVREHQRRRDEDYRDWQLMLTEYVGMKKGSPPSRRCLRRVLLAFLNTGEDVVDAGCGACSGCSPEGSFLPLAERAARIIAFPPELWSRLEAVRKAVDVLPDVDVFRGLCAFLRREDGGRWRQAVHLNAERMLREDSGSAGATALMICLIAHGWLDRDESDLHRLFDALWRKRAALGAGPARLAELAAEARPESVLLAYWRARAAHAEDPIAGLNCWEALLERQGVPREYAHEAASALAARGDLLRALLAARTSRDAEEARSAYSALGQVDLLSAAAIRDEAAAVFAAVGSERERTETFVGLVLAAFGRGAPGSELMDVLDANWSQIEPALSRLALVRLLGTLTGPLAADSRWPTRFLRFLTGEDSEPLCGGILTLCARSLEEGGSFTDSDNDRIAAALCLADPAQSGAGALPGKVLCALLKHLWGWAIEWRPDVVRSLLALELDPEGRTIRLGLLQDFMAGLLFARAVVRGRGGEVARRGL
jgi:superfamily II DNA helicase RecQ